MKNTLVLLCLLICNTVISQTKQQFFGFRVAASVANFYSNSPYDNYNPRGLSYEFGASTCVVRNNRIGFIAEMNYAQKNVKSDRFGYSLNYLTINLLPNYYFSKSKTTVFLGVNGGGLLFYKVIDDYPKSRQYFGGRDLNLIVGFSQQMFRFNGFKVDLDSRANWGLLDIQPYWGDDTRNYGFSIGVLIKKNPRKST